jgi:hypothetical protein
MPACLVLVGRVRKMPTLLLLLVGEPGGIG